MSYYGQKEFIHFMIRNGQLIEHRFQSDPSMWPKNGRLYALASDPVAVERCRSFAISRSPAIQEVRRELDQIAVERISPQTCRKPLLGPGTRERLAALMRPRPKS